MQMIRCFKIEAAFKQCSPNSGQSQCRVPDDVSSSTRGDYKPYITIGRSPEILRNFLKMSIKIIKNMKIYPENFRKHLKMFDLLQPTEMTSSVAQAEFWFGEGGHLATKRLQTGLCRGKEAAAPRWQRSLSFELLAIYSSFK